MHIFCYSLHPLTTIYCFTIFIVSQNAIASKWTKIRKKYIYLYKTPLTRNINLWKNQRIEKMV